MESTRLKLLAAIACMGLGNVAFADVTYTCQSGERSRIIQVVYESDEYDVPCSVVYKKETETRTLWSAGTDSGYCESKAEAFVEKQRGWGWECELEGVMSLEDEGTL